MFKETSICSNKHLKNSVHTVFTIKLNEIFKDNAPQTKCSTTFYLSGKRTHTLKSAQKFTLPITFEKLSYLDESRYNCSPQ